MRLDVNAPGYTLAFATVVCVVCSLFVAASAVLLKDRQRLAQNLYVQKNVLLDVTGLAPAGDTGVNRADLFRERIEARLVDTRTGEYVRDAGVDPLAFDQRRASTDPQQSHEVPENPAEVRRVANLATVYLVKDGDGYSQVVIPIRGKGLYSVLHGFLALDRDMTTIRGIAFYEHGETPGLGGEVTNPEWRALWPGRKAYGPEGNVRIELVKGKAGPPEASPFQVDALAGATGTSDGVTHMLHFWLGEHGFKPYVQKVRERGAL